MKNYHDGATACRWHVTVILLVDKRNTGVIRFLWSMCLIFILVINMVTIYTVNHVNNSQYRRIILHNFAANMTFGTCKLLQELLVHPSDGCTSSLKTALYFLEIWGSTSSITGVTSLSLLQYWILQNLNINNKITRNNSRRDGKFKVTTATLLAVFTISSINSTVPTFIRRHWVEYLPVCTGLVTISLGTLITSRIFSIIKIHRRRIRRKSTRNSTLLRSQRLLKGSGVLLLLGWFPSLVCQLIVLQQQGHTNKLLKWLICIALIFPILHPLLYFTKSNDMKSFVVNRLLKCHSSEHKQAVEFYSKLSFRRRYRRSKQIEPFIIDHSHSKLSLIHI